MKHLTCTWEFLVEPGDEGPFDLEANVDRVMVALLDQEDRDEQLTDAGVGLSLDTRRVEISVTVLGDLSVALAITKGTEAISRAIAAAGGRMIGEAENPLDQPIPLIPVRDRTVEFHHRELIAV